MRNVGLATNWNKLGYDELLKINRKNLRKMVIKIIIIKTHAKSSKTNYNEN